MSQRLENPATRVTIMVDGDLDKKVRMRQARIIKETQESVSYSKVLNQIVALGLKKRRSSEVTRPNYEETDRRVTVMMDSETDKEIKIRYGNHIIECANKHCELPSWSYSREVNRLLRLGFRK